MMQEGQQLHSPYLVSCILNAFLCYIAIVLNIVTIQGIRKTSSLSKTLNTMLLSLSVSDLGVGLLAQPLYIALCAVNFKQDSYNNPTYKITYSVFLIWGYLFSFASFFGVTTLIADRFLAVHSYLRYQELVTRKRVVALVILIWAFSAILSLIVLLIPKNISYPIFGVIVLSCIIATTFFSVKIYLNVRRHMNQVQVLQVNQVAKNGDMANIVRLRKFAIAAIYVYLVFLVCYLPKNCILLVAPLISGEIDKKRLQLYNICTSTLVFLNSSLNPLVYCWKMKHIRHAIMDILRNAFSSYN